MTDRELLEMAAKAAGYQIEWVRNSGCYDRCEEEIGRETWDPLDDDGDALRLAVRLGLFSTQQGLGEFQAFYSDEISRDHRPTTATRRAIVTIAAEIGRAMP